MGKHITRGDAWMDPSYIVNLTKNIIGERALFALSADPAGGHNGHALRVFFWERIEKRVSKMSDQSLGHVCTYGGPRGFHMGPAIQTEFLNMTGYKDVCNWTLDPSQKNGREILEELAILTIVCVARDIIRQGDWQLNAAIELDEDVQFERGMRDYIHHGHR